MAVITQFSFHQHCISYRHVGSGRNLLLLHGFPTSSYDWEPMMELLQDSYHLWAVDFLGYGLSDKPRPHQYSIFEQANLLEAFASEQKITDVDLICHDYGDTVGLELLTREGRLPFKINKVILLNGSVYFDLVQLRPIQRILLWKGVGSVISRLMSRRIFGKQLGAVFSSNHPISETELDKHWKLLTYNNGRAVYPALAQYIQERRKYAAERWEPVLESLGKRLCVIWGMDDPVAVGAMAQRIQQRVPEATVHFLEGIGHYPQLEVPQQVADKIRQFLTAEA